MQAGGTSQVMSRDNRLLWWIYVCVCMTRWSTSQYSGPVCESHQSNHRTDICRHEVGVQLRGIWDHKVNDLQGEDIGAHVVTQNCHGQNYSVTLTIFHSATHW